MSTGEETGGCGYRRIAIEEPTPRPRTMKDVALLVLDLLDNCQHFEDVAGSLRPDDSGVMSFECDGRRYELNVTPISPELEAEVYGNSGGTAR